MTEAHCEVLMDYSFGQSMHTFLESLERELVVAAMTEADGNCAGAAKLLGISRTALIDKRKRFGLPIGKPGRKKENGTE